MGNTGPILVLKTKVGLGMRAELRMREALGTSAELRMREDLSTTVDMTTRIGGAGQSVFVIDRYGGRLLLVGFKKIGTALNRPGNRITPKNHGDNHSHAKKKSISPPTLLQKSSI
jgi:hypothetical protein